MLKTKQCSIVSFLLNIILLIILQSCSNPIKPVYKSTTSHFLLPAKNGNYWEYKRLTPDIGSADTALIYKNFSSFGISLNSNVPSRDFRWEIVDSIDIKLDNVIYPSYVFDFFFYDQNEYSNFNKPYWFGEDGIYHMGIFGKGVDTVFSKGLYIPTEVTLNIPWNGSAVLRYDGKFTSKSVKERKCISKNEIIEIPLGKYNCYVIYTREDEADDYTVYIDSYEYFAPNIGLVAKVEIRIVPQGEDISGHFGWWRIKYAYMITDFSLN